MRFRTSALFGAVMTAALAAAPALAADQIAQAKADLNFGTGNQGGSQYPITVAIAQVLEKQPQFGKISLQPGGSVGNIVRVDTGKSDMAISMSMSLLDGRNGTAPFKSKTENVVNLFTLHAFYVVALVPDDSPIKAFKDFAGKKLNIAPKGYSITEVGLQLLKKVELQGKVNIGHLRIVESVEALKDGHYDGLLYAASDRFGPFMSLAQTRKVRLVPVEKPVLEAYMKENPSFFMTTWPKNRSVYKNLVNTVETLGYPNVVVAHKTRISDAQAYAIVKAVAENFDQIRIAEPSLADFEPKEMARVVGSPFHPGAVRYYREKGWMK